MSFYEVSGEEWEGGYLQTSKEEEWQFKTANTIKKCTRNRSK